MVGFPPQIPCVTPVLLGPGSDTPLKMECKKSDKNGKVWGLVFPECRGYVTPVACWCCGLGMEGIIPHSLGRFLVVPRAPVHIRNGRAQLSGRILESGVGHC